MIKRLAIIGYGAIAKDVLIALSALLEKHAVEVLIVKRSALSEAEQSTLPPFVRVSQDPNQLWEFKADLVIEAAGQTSVAQFVPACLSSGADVLITSIGALANSDLYSSLRRVAEQFNSRILLPAGAIAGLDYLQSIKDTEGVQVLYESHKPVSAWLPELKALGLNADSVKEPLLLFEGSAAEAATRYPQNLNVAATLAIAGIGMDKTRVRVLVNPSLSQNQHHILVTSPFGEMRLQLSNTPSPSNPKSSWVVAQSIAAVVKKEFSALQL
ncbi:MAG TPA: aspartate dehydrogenase [Oligella sp.]|nr:aspartate dehydrogenase [Alcaligenaceae bacterium]HZJ96474.1 aspartate dehydrogenase [Oligella sp.]